MKLKYVKSLICFGLSLLLWTTFILIRNNTVYDYLNWEWKATAEEANVVTNKSRKRERCWALLQICICRYCPYLSESRKGQTSGTGGVEGRSFASAMMCSKVMSVWVHTSTTWISWGGPWGRPLGVRLMTCTTTGSLAVRKASTVSSWLDFDNSFPFTWAKHENILCEYILSGVVW